MERVLECLTEVATLKTKCVDMLGVGAHDVRGAGWGANVRVEVFVLRFHQNFKIPEKLLSCPTSTDDLSKLTVAIEQHAIFFYNMGFTLKVKRFKKVKNICILIHVCLRLCRIRPPTLTY